MELIKEFLEGRIPDVPGVKLEMKKSGEKDDECLYFNLPLEMDEEFYLVHWGSGRRTAALYSEWEFDRLYEFLQDMAYREGPGRRYVRMLLLSAHFSSYRENLGFSIRPILLDERLGQWEYIEMPAEERILSSLDPTRACPFAFVTARDPASVS